jgi:hypothetical protein
VSAFSNGAFSTSAFSESAFDFGTVAVVAETYSGGWFIASAYERQLLERKRRRQEIEEAEEAAESIEDEVSKEIATLLHKQERIDAERDHFEDLRALVRNYQPTEALPQRVSDAIAKAQAQETMSALRQLDKELKRMLEEEELAVLLLMLND